MSDEVLVKVENVSKKFCRSLKKSLWYGVQDIATELSGHKIEKELRSDEFWAVKDVSFEVKRGECLALIGPNGAGKSTLLKMLNNLIKPDRGCIRMRGRVGALIELGAGFNPILTGRENIYVNGAVLGLSKAEIDRKFDEIIEFAEIGDFLDTPVQNYSSGMRVRLGFAVASNLATDILLIDEVLAVGDIAFRLKCFNRIKNIIASGIAVIFVSHDVNSISRVCNRGIVIEYGNKRYDGNPSNAINQYEKILLNCSSNRAKITTANKSVTVEKVETLDLYGNKNDAFKSGDSIRFKIFYRATQNHENITFVFRLGSTKIGDFSSFTNHVKNCKIPILKGRHNIELKLLNLPLLAGTYFAKLDLYDSDCLIFIESKEIISIFEISEPIIDTFKEYYTFRLDHDWVINY